RLSQRVPAQASADHRGRAAGRDPKIREAAETFASKLFPRTPRLLQTEPLKALVIGAFVRGLSMRDAEDLCEKAGLGKLSKSTASRICEELGDRFEAFKRRDLYGSTSLRCFWTRRISRFVPQGPRTGAGGLGLYRRGRAGAPLGDVGDARVAQRLAGARPRP